MAARLNWEGRSLQRGTSRSPEPPGPLPYAGTSLQNRNDLSDSKSLNLGSESAAISRRIRGREKGFKW